MQKPRVFLWAWVLLAASLCWLAGSAFAQNPQTKPNANQKTQAPIKQLNPNQQRRQAVMDELAAAVDARMKADPQFKAYIEAVNQHNKNVEEFVKAKKGGGR